MECRASPPGSNYVLGWPGEDARRSIERFIDTLKL